MTVNGEVYFLFNLTLDFLLLWATGVWAGEVVRPWRCLGGAAFGAVYALAALFPAGSWLWWLPSKVGAALVMIGLAYGWIGWRATVKLTGVFFLIYFAAGGASLAIAASGAQGGWGRGVFWLRRTNLIPAAVLATAVLGRQVIGLLAHRLGRRLQTVVAEVEFAGRSVKLNALVDSGHHLVDPLSGEPVLVAAFRPLREVIPAELVPLFEGGAEPDPAEVALRCAPTPWGPRLRLIPYRSLGRPDGLLPGFRSDRCRVWLREREIASRPVIVGITAGDLEQDRGYDALCPPEMLARAHEAGGR